jgi:Lon protease-like protein
MFGPIDVASDLENFSGQAPLFPLPDVAQFPHALLPVHIFEPRYRQMTTAALEGERLIALAQLRPGWETAGESDRPAVFETVCLCRIVAEEKLPDGRFYLILQGLARGRVIAEESTDLPYRVARIELRPDRVLPVSAINRENRRRELLEGLRDLYPRPEIEALFHEIADGSVSLGSICDVVASVLRLPADQAQGILAEEDVDLRSDLVLERLRELRRRRQGRRSQQTFPPGFSEN